jgi:hypothetical protein
MRDLNKIILTFVIFYQKSTNSPIFLAAAPKGRVEKPRTAWGGLMRAASGLGPFVSVCLD